MSTGTLEALAGAQPQAARALEWASDKPAISGDYERDSALNSVFWQRGLAHLATLPPRPKRSPQDQAVADHILALSRAARSNFLATHGTVLYAQLTAQLSAYRRVEDLAYRTAAAI